MANIKNLQATFRVPPDFNSSQRELVARLIIEKIQDNTSKGLDRNGRRFKPYSKDYINSLDFKNAGKSSSNINLELTGDMLISLQLIMHSQGSITIGYPSGSSIAGQVEGNVLGSYGGVENPAKARPFIGTSKLSARSNNSKSTV